MYIKSFRFLLVLAVVAVVPFKSEAGRHRPKRTRESYEKEYVKLLDRAGLNRPALERIAQKAIDFSCQPGPAEENNFENELHARWPEVSSAPELPESLKKLIYFSRWLNQNERILGFRALMETLDFLKANPPEDSTRPGDLTGDDIVDYSDRIKLEEIVSYSELMNILTKAKNTPQISEVFDRWTISDEPHELDVHVRSAENSFRESASREQRLAIFFEQILARKNSLDPRQPQEKALAADLEAFWRLLVRNAQAEDLKAAWQEIHGLVQELKLFLVDLYHFNSLGRSTIRPWLQIQDEWENLNLWPAWIKFLTPICQSNSAFFNTMESSFEADEFPYWRKEEINRHCQKVLPLIEERAKYWEGRIKDPEQFFSSLSQQEFSISKPEKSNGSEKRKKVPGEPDKISKSLFVQWTRDLSFGNLLPRGALNTQALYRALRFVQEDLPLLGMAYFLPADGTSSLYADWIVNRTSVVSSDKKMIDATRATWMGMPLNFTKNTTFDFFSQDFDALDFLLFPSVQDLLALDADLEKYQNFRPFYSWVVVQRKAKNCVVEDQWKWEQLLKFLGIDPRVLEIENQWTQGVALENLLNLDFNHDGDVNLADFETFQNSESWFR